MRFFKTGLVKGILVGLLWWLIGFMLVEIIRVAMGLPLQFDASVPPGPVAGQNALQWIVSGGLAAYEPAMVVAAFFFAIGFMLGAGTMTDWLKWARGVETPMHHGPKEGQPSWFRYFSADYSHKIIGVQYGVTAVILLMFAGTLALIFRVELANPNLQLSLFGANPKCRARELVQHVGRRTRHDHDRRDPAGRRRHVQLPGAADDRRHRHGLPPAERVRLLDQRARRHAAGHRHVHRRLEHWLDRLPAPERPVAARRAVLLPGRVLHRPVVDPGLAEHHRHYPDACGRPA